MPPRDSALHAVGIDLGTTYSCLSYLTPQGQPVACPNAEGELTTPSVVLFDGDEIVVGTEALRNAVAQPERVVHTTPFGEGVRVAGQPLGYEGTHPVQASLDIAVVAVGPERVDARLPFVEIGHALHSAPTHRSSQSGRMRAQNPTL